MSKAFHLSKLRFYESGKANGLLMWLQKSLTALKFCGTVITFPVIRLKKNNSSQRVQYAPLGVCGWVTPIARHGSPAPSVGIELPITMGHGARICVRDSVIEIKSAFFYFS